MAKCNRTVCNNEGVYEHNDIRKLYCAECVRKINNACKQDFFDVTKCGVSLAEYDAAADAVKYTPVGPVDMFLSPRVIAEFDRRNLAGEAVAVYYSDKLTGAASELRASQAYHAEAQKIKNK